MFTTQIGPPNIGEDYVGMLRNYLMRNVNADPSLKDVLLTRTGYSEITELQANAFPSFFKLGVPKLLASVLLEEDWYVDPTLGIQTYQFDRPSSTGPYTMLHFVMDVTRQEPPRERRAPNSGHEPGAAAAYTSVTRGLFESREIEVNEAMVAGITPKPTLDEIKSRRKKYYLEGE